tara:strand:- start:25 stop:537 length:513 start_codon:yes stop_codon:yes gene_type:complete
MALKYFAKLDDNNIVIHVTLIECDTEEAGQTLLRQINDDTAVYKEYDPDTHMNHKLPGTSGTPFRGNAAGIGDTYDSVNDVFIGEKPKNRNGVECTNWVYNSEFACWRAPVDASTALVHADVDEVQDILRGKKNPMYRPPRTDAMKSAKQKWDWKDDLSGWEEVDDPNLS